MSSTTDISKSLRKVLMTAPNRMAGENINGKWVTYFEIHDSDALVDLIDRAVKKAQLGMIDYYDQAPTNDSCDWKGLLADNRKTIEYELSQLSNTTGAKAGVIDETMQG